MVRDDARRRSLKREPTAGSVGEPSSDSVAGSLNVRSPFCGWRVGQGPKTVPLILSLPLHATAVTTPVMSLYSAELILP
jgi:hypothetical protein